MVGLAGADADRPLQRQYEDLAVADLSGPAPLAERGDRRLDEVVRDRDLEPGLVGQPHLHGGAAVRLDPFELPTMALHARHRYAAHLTAKQRFEHVVRLLWTNDPDNKLQEPFLPY